MPCSHRIPGGRGIRVISLGLTMRVALLVLLALTQKAVFAVSSTEVESLFACKYDGNQQEMNACALKDYKHADRLLNEKYKATLSSLQPGKRQALRKEQRAWLKGRDPNCKAAVADSEGGSIWQLEYFSCLKSATELRTKALEKWQTNH